MTDDVFGKLKRTGPYGYDNDGIYGLTGAKSSKLANIARDKRTVEEYHGKLAELQALSNPDVDAQRKLKWYQEHIALVCDRIAREEARLSL